MVKNYRKINDDIRVVLNLAKQRLAEETRDVLYHNTPKVLILQIEDKQSAIIRLESAIKS